MDWAREIERHRVALLRIVAALFAMIGLAEKGAVERVSRPLCLAVLGILRPAEAAVRRLIVVAARDMVVKPAKARPVPAGSKISGKSGNRVSFQLFDPRQRFNKYGGLSRYRRTRPEPRIWTIDADPTVARLLRSHTVAHALKPDGTVSALRLCRRLAAVKRALNDLTAQARRYARWRAKPLEVRRPKRAAALRSGAPPGFPRKSSHAVHEILTQCDRLARTLLAPNTG